MKWLIIIRPRAEADLLDACRWYEAQRPGLGDQFLDEVRQAIARLQEAADQRPLYYRDFRRLLTRRFPYKLFYLIEHDRVIVTRILHARRDHRRWL